MTQQQYEARQEALQAPTPTPLVVSFAGYAGVGKNTAADALLNAKPEEVGGRVFVSIAVADAIKDALLAVNPFVGPEGSCYPLADWAVDAGWDETHRMPEVRCMLEALGAWGRNIDPYFWAKLAARRVASAVGAGYSVVVTDVRHLNELDLLLDVREDFLLCTLLVQRPDVGPVSDNERVATQWFDDEIDYSLDHVLVNDSTPDALKRKVLAALKGVL